MNNSTATITDLTTGRQAAQRSYYPSAIAVDGNTLVVVAKGPKAADEAIATAYDPTGKVKWEAAGYRAITVAGSALVVLIKYTPRTTFDGAKTELVFRDIESGRDVYRKEIPSEGNYTTVPAWQVYRGGFVIDTDEGAEIYGNDGRRIAVANGWHAAHTPGSDPQNTPYSDRNTKITSEGREYYRMTPGFAPPVPFLRAAGSDEVWGAFSPRSGNLLWSTEIPGREFKSTQTGDSYFNIAGLGSAILISTFYPADKITYRVYNAYSGEGGALPVGQIPVATDGTLFATTKGRTVSVSRPGTGDPLWSLELTADPVAIDGKIYYSYSRLL